jgi:hypothetical protein
MKIAAVYSNPSRGPCFPGGFSVWDNCNADTNSYSQFFGSHYTNDSGLDGTTFFTGAWNFQVKEIEVFEIAA